MNRKQLTTFGLSFALITLFSACGPMNTEKKTDAGPANSEQSLKGIASTQNNVFYVHMTQQGASTAASPDVGDNAYLVRIVHASDLSGLSDQAKVTISYWMPDMPAMGKSDATATRQADGSYAVTLFFSMAGRWQITVTMQDGSTQDNYVFETKF